MKVRVFDQGSEVRVTVSAQEATDWSNTWPGSGFSAAGFSFAFDKRNGDLIDSNDAEKHRSADRGAVAALAQDAQNIAAIRLGIPEMERPV